MGEVKILDKAQPTARKRGEKYSFSFKAVRI
jgi:hypothetical protein